jgi:hypothetical protein
LYPTWSRDGREIIFQDASSRIAAAQVAANGDRFEVGAVETLFEVARSAAPGRGGLMSFAPAPDAQRFLVIRRTAQEASDSLTLVMNWAAELKK